MFSNELDLRRELIDIGQRSEALDLVIYSAGNFSARSSKAERILITPSGVPYSDMRPEDIVAVDPHGDVIDGSHEPSSEVAVHTLAYLTRRWVGGCAHTESPYVNALYTMNKGIPGILDNFVYLFAGRGLAVAPAFKSGSQEFAEATLEAMDDRFGVVWKNHGLFCVGQDIEVAFRRCWVAEQAARVYYLALSLGEGEPDLIPQDVQEEMIEAVRERGWGAPV